MNSIHKDLFCTQCELQFDGSFIYGRHLNVVHGKKDFSQSSKNEREWNESIEDDSHGASVAKSDFSKPLASFHDGKKSFKCEICDYSCSLKPNFKRHVASVHGEKKPFKCDICEYSCSHKCHI